MKTKEEILRHIKNAEKEVAVFKREYSMLSQRDMQSGVGNNLLLNRYRLEGLIAGLYWTIDMKQTLGK
jgi:hypothetical protein